MVKCFRIRRRLEQNASGLGTFHGLGPTSHGSLSPVMGRSSNPIPNIATEICRQHCRARTHKPMASMSLISTAIWARFAASATRLKSLKNGDVAFASPITLCACGWATGACAAAACCCCDADVGTWPCCWKYCGGWFKDGDDSGASIVGLGGGEV